MCPISTPRCPGRHAVPAPATARSRCVRSGSCRTQVVPQAEDARATAEAAARRSYGKLVAFLAARTGDVAGAEDALSEAFAAALADWPARGSPDNPEAWLVIVARRKMIDAGRRRRSGTAAADHLRLMAEELQAVQESTLAGEANIP